MNHNRKSASTGINKILFILSIVFTILILDHLTKVLVERHISPYEQITLIDGFLDLVYVRNTGVAFGIFNNAKGGGIRIFITLASLFAIAVIIYYLIEFDFTTKKRYITSISLILGGALGNMFDRIFKGYVVDMVHMHIGRYSWPAYNVADIGITLGVSLIVLFSITDKEK